MPVPPDAPPAPALLVAEGITKRYPGVTALDSVAFEVRAGEVHALMGENGAGKSTLLRVITGAVRADAGAMTLLGEAYAPASPPAAQRSGVAAVHQESGLVGTLSVAENLFLARYPRRRRLPWLIDRRAMGRRAADLLRSLHLDIDPGAPLGSFPIAIRQMVAIGRAVDQNARLIAFDEPTSSLGMQETAELFATIERLKSRGIGIVFVTHFLDQVYRVADRITVLRNGRGVGTFAAPDLPRVRLVAHMLGRELPAAGRAPAAAGESGPARSRSAPPVLSARGIGRRRSIGPIDLDLHRSEVVGVAGLLGSGRTETLRLLFGADRTDSGTLSVEAKPARLRSPRDAVARGIAFCPEDRKADGLFLSMSILDNIAMVVQRTLGRLGLMRRADHRRIAGDLIARLGIRADATRPARTLSGGNQQKVLLARWLAMDPRILLLDEPTRGIDVGARAEIERTLRDLAGRGMAVLFTSSDLDEIVRTSDRAVVLRGGRAVARREGPELDDRTLMADLAGAAP